MTTIVAVGHKKIRFMVIDRHGGRASLVRTETFLCDGDIFATADTVSAVARIAAFVRQHKIPADHVVFSLVHEALVIKELSLPLASAQDIDRIMAHQIESIARFSSGNYGLAYQALQDASSGKIHVIYCVLAKEVMDRAVDILTSAGLDLVAFDLIPCSVVSLASPQSVQKEAVPNIIVEDGVTYILVSKGYETVAIYSVDMGTDMLAEGAPAVRTWAANVDRTLRSHETLKGGALAPFRLFWDNQMSPELDKSLAEISGRDHVAPRLEDSGLLERNSFAVMDYSYWPLLGIYLRRFQEGHMFSVQNMWNVRTTSVYQSTALFGTAAAILFVGVIAAVFLVGIGNEKADLETQKKRVEAQIVSLEATTKTMKAEREKAARLRRNVLKQAAIVSSVKQFSWANVFTYINSAIPEDVWLKSFSLHRSGQVSLVGTGLNMDAVAKLLRGLEKNDKLARVEMKSTSQRKLENIDVVDFNITAMLVPSVQEKK